MWAIEPMHHIASARIWPLILNCMIMLTNPLLLLLLLVLQVGVKALKECHGSGCDESSSGLKPQTACEESNVVETDVGPDCTSQQQQQQQQPRILYKCPESSRLAQLSDDSPAPDPPLQLIHAANVESFMLSDELWSGSGLQPIARGAEAQVFLLTSGRLLVKEGDGAKLVMAAIRIEQDVESSKFQADWDTVQQVATRVGEAMLPMIAAVHIEDLDGGGIGTVMSLMPFCHLSVQRLAIMVSQLGSTDPSREATLGEAAVSILLGFSIHIAAQCQREKLLLPDSKTQNTMVDDEGRCWAIDYT